MFSRLIAGVNLSHDEIMEVGMRLTVWAVEGHVRD